MTMTHRRRVSLVPAVLLLGACACLAQDAREVDDLLSRADRRLHEGSVKEAIADYDAAIALEPGRGAAWIGRARAKLASNDLAGAHADIDEAIELLPEEGAAYFERGRVRFAQGDVQGAIEDHGKAIELQKDPLRAWVARGWCKLTIGDFAGAIADYDAAAELDPDDGHVFKNRARARFEQEDLDGALADLDRALTIKADDVAALLARAMVRARKGDEAGTRADCDAVAGLAGQNPGVRYTCGSLRGLLGDHEAALADYGVSLEQRASGPAAVRALNNRAVIRAQAGDLDQAMADLDRAVSLDPKSPSVRSNRGWLLALKGELEPALKEYAEAIELDARGGAYAYRGRAWARALQANDPAAAMEDLREAARRTLAERRISSNWNVRGEAFDRMGSRLVLEEPEYGPADLLKAAEGPAVPLLRRERVGRARGLLGLLAEVQGKKDEALAHYRVAADEGLEHLLEVRWARRRVEALGGGK